MTPAQALAKIKKLIGPKAEIRGYRKPSSPEQREQVRVERAHLATKKAEAQDRLNRRREAILLADNEYQRLKAEYTDAANALMDAPSPDYYRYMAGRNESIFFSITAQADNLQELVEAVEKKVNK